jgi:hypothetical protein
VYAVLEVCCTRYMLYSVYAVLGVCCTRCMLYLVYVVFGVCCTRCILYLVYAVLGVCCTRCMLYSVYAVLGVCCTRCMLYSVYAVHSVHQRNVIRFGSNTQSSQTLQATSPVLLSTSTCSQTPVELSKVPSDSARALSGAPEST